MEEKQIHTVQLPEIGRYELTYYISDSPQKTPAKIYPRHVHDSLEILILLQGTCHFSVESELYSMQPRDAIMIRPNEVHNCILTGPTVFQHMCFQLTPANGSVIDDILPLPQGKNRCVTLEEEALARVYEIARQLSGATDRLQQAYLMLEFLYLMKRTTPSHHAQEADVPVVLQRILHDINKNFQKIDRLDYLTETYFISPSTLGRLFHTYLHVTPRQYLETKRLAYSRILLKQGYSVNDAGTASGFVNCSHYIRLFRARFGMTPKQYQCSQPFELLLPPDGDKVLQKARSQTQ